MHPLLRNSIALAAVLACIGMSATGEEAQTLASAGRSDYRIVIAQDAIPAERFAAEELVRFIEEMSGAALPIVTDEAPLPAHAIVLGPSRRLASLGVVYDELPLGKEGYLIKTTGDHLLIVGGRPRGTLYGVYGFLEDVLGCRWYAPDENLVPKRATISVAPVNRVNCPALEYREGWLYIGGCMGAWWSRNYDADWITRNRMNGGRPPPLDERHGGSFTESPRHSLASDVVPIQEYAQTKPEYYALVDGKRTVTADCQVCMSSPEVIRVATEHVRRRMRRNPDAELIWVTQGDNSKFCQCAACQELYARYGDWDSALDQPLPPGTPQGWKDGYGGITGALLHFVNGIADNLEDEFPDRRIATFAYQPTRRPPRGIAPHRNVVVWYCAIERCHCHPFGHGPTSGLFYHHAAELAAWTRLAKTVYVYEYMGNMNLAPDLLNLAQDVRLYRDMGVKGITSDSIQEAHTGFGYLRFYIWMKLLWNPDFDAESGMREFLNAYYGAAAPYLRGFINLLDRPESWQRIHPAQLTPWTEDAVNPVAAERFRNCKLRNLTRRALEDAEDLFRQAEAAVTGDNSRHERVQAARLPFDRAVLESPELPADDPRRRQAADRFFTQAEKSGLTGISPFKTIGTYRKEVYERLESQPDAER